MADINHVDLFRRFGSDVKIRNFPAGRKIAASSIANDTGPYEADKGGLVSNLQRHSYLTCQQELVRVLKERNRKGVRAIVRRQLIDRNWRKDGETTDRTKVGLNIGIGGGVKLSTKIRLHARDHSVGYNPPMRQHMSLSVCRI